MLGERIRELRRIRGLTSAELAEKIGKSRSSLSRYENNITYKWDSEIVDSLAKALNVSSSYLLGITDDPNFSLVEEIEDFTSKDQLANVIVRNDEMSPVIPKGAIVKIRTMKNGESLQDGSLYYVEFGKKKCFRMAVDDEENGLGIMPNNISERRIAYDQEYVRVIGKAVSMKVIFEDN